MSRLDFDTSHETKEQCYLLTESEHATPPFDLQLIEREQDKCAQLKELKVKGDVKEKESAEGLFLWHFKPRQSKTYQIFVPKILQIPLVEWYHDALKHPGTSRTKDTICQHYDWPDATKTINEVVRKCSCQMSKITGQRNYGHLPLTTTRRDNPWSNIHVDMVGPWTITVTNEETEKRTEERYKHWHVAAPVLDDWRSSNAIPRPRSTYPRNSTATGYVVIQDRTELSTITVGNSQAVSSKNC